MDLKVARSRWCIAVNETHIISQLWDVTYHTGSHGATFHPTQVNIPSRNPSQIGRCLI